MGAKCCSNLSKYNKYKSNEVINIGNNFNSNNNCQFTKSFNNKKLEIKKDISNIIEEKKQQLKSNNNFNCASNDLSNISEKIINKVKSDNKFDNIYSNISIGNKKSIISKKNSISSSKSIVNKMYSNNSSLNNSFNDKSENKSVNNAKSTIINKVNNTNNVNVYVYDREYIIEKKDDKMLSCVNYYNKTNNYNNKSKGYKTANYINTSYKDYVKEIKLRKRKGLYKNNSKLIKNNKTDNKLNNSIIINNLENNYNKLKNNEISNFKRRNKKIVNNLKDYQINNLQNTIKENKSPLKTNIKDNDINNKQVFGYKGDYLLLNDKEKSNIKHKEKQEKTNIKFKEVLNAELNNNINNVSTNNIQINYNCFDTNNLKNITNNPNFNKIEGKLNTSLNYKKIETNFKVQVGEYLQNVWVEKDSMLRFYVEGEYNIGSKYIGISCFGAKNLEEIYEKQSKINTKNDEKIRLRASKSLEISRIPDINFGCLMGRIGSENKYFPVSNYHIHKTNSSGPLLFSLNFLNKKFLYEKLICIKNEEFLLSGKFKIIIEGAIETTYDQILDNCKIYNYIENYNINNFNYLCNTSKDKTHANIISEMIDILNRIRIEPRFFANNILKVFSNSFFDKNLQRIYYFLINYSNTNKLNPLNLVTNKSKTINKKTYFKNTKTIKSAKTTKTYNNIYSKLNTKLSINIDEYEEECVKYYSLSKQKIQDFFDKNCKHNLNNYDNNLVDEIDFEELNILSNKYSSKSKKNSNKKSFSNNIIINNFNTIDININKDDNLLINDSKNYLENKIDKINNKKTKLIKRKTSNSIDIIEKDLNNNIEIDKSINQSIEIKNNKILDLSNRKIIEKRNINDYLLELALINENKDALNDINNISFDLEFAHFKNFIQYNFDYTSNAYYNIVQLLLLDYIPETDCFASLFNNEFETVEIKINSINNLDKDDKLDNTNNSDYFLNILFTIFLKNP